MSQQNGKGSRQRQVDLIDEQEMTRRWYDVMPRREKKDGRTFRVRYDLYGKRITEQTVEGP
jgi:site-specific recombinase XerC